MKTKTSTAGSSRGFTLLELLVVLFIAGLAMAVVAFSASQLRDKSLFAEEARKVYLTLKHARETAIIERREISFRINEEANSYWLDFGGTGSQKTHTVPGRFPLSGKDIFFFPKGNSSGGLIEIKNEKGRKYAIEVDRVLGTASIKRL